MSWTWMVSDRRYGQKTFISQNFDEIYVIGPKGAWVADGDVEWLKSIRWPCQSGDRIQVFDEGRPTAKQMATKPSREPKKKTSHKQSPRKKKRRYKEG